MRSQNPLTKFKPKIRFKLPEIDPEEFYEDEGVLDPESTGPLFGEGFFADLMMAALYRSPILAGFPIGETRKTPLIWICGTPWWIWQDRIDGNKPVHMRWVEDMWSPTDGVEIRPILDITYRLRDTEAVEP